MNSLLKVKRRQHFTGFSLVELMVSLTIFSIIMVVSIGTLLTMVDANAKAQAMYTAMTNLSFALDNISREVRTGKDFLCLYTNDARFDESSLPSGTGDCTPNGKTAIVFTRYRDGARVAYRYHGDVIEQKIVDDNPVINTGWQAATSINSMKITSFDIVVSGSDSTDALQSQVALLIQGEVSNGLDVPTDFMIQTKVTQRILDY